MRNQVESIVDQIIRYLRVDGAFIDALTLQRMQQLFQLIQQLPEHQSDIVSFREYARQRSSVLSKVLMKCSVCKKLLEINDLTAHLKSCGEYQKILLREKKRKQRKKELNERVMTEMEKEMERIRRLVNRWRGI